MKIYPYASYLSFSELLYYLYLGILTALTGIGISQVAPAFADKEECEDNDDNNCNQRTHKIILENNCKSLIEFEHSGTIGTAAINNPITCLNQLTSPANGDDNEFGDNALGPLGTTASDEVFGPTTLIPDIP